MPLLPKRSALPIGTAVLSDPSPTPSGAITLTLVNTLSPSDSTFITLTPSDTNTSTPSATVGITSTSESLTPTTQSTSLPIPEASVSDESTPTALEGSGALGSASLPKGAIAAIIVVIVLILAGGALLLVRVLYKRSRTKKRTSRMDMIAPTKPSWFGIRSSTRQEVFTNVTPFAVQQTGFGPVSTPQYQYPQPPVPPMPNAASSAMMSQSLSSPAGPFLTPISYPYSNGTASAVVLKTFVPTLSDELSILAGERVTVLESFDDGWAQVCRAGSNNPVDKGMVPLECLVLDGASSVQPTRSPRASSISPAF